MTRKFLAVILTLAFLLPACQQTGAPPQAMSQEAITYLDRVLDIMQHHSINRHQIDWSRFRWRLFALAEGAQTPADTHTALRFMVTQLGDRHSRFIPPPEAAGSSPQPTQTPPLPSGDMIEGRIGYLSLPYLVGDGPHAALYAQQLHTLIRDLDAQHPCGWIVDLGANQGGNMWPMLAGIGPILGTGEAGRFQDPDGVVTSWSYHAGQALLDTTPMAHVANPYTLRDPDPPVAVLTSEQTASSGEAIAVAFRGRPNTRSFGHSTAGLSTGNETYTLSDGAILVLTEVVFVDRTGTPYGQAIEPDEPSTRFGTSARERAIAWLRAQPACK